MGANLGPVLGPLHPIVGENLAMIKAVSKLDEVSFHMSGTEAVMCAVRLAAFNTRRKLVVTFAGAYHGWWDGVQPGIGNERTNTDVLPLKDMSPASLTTIRARKDEIACVVVNPLQGFNPNSPPPNDLVLMTAAMREASSSETLDHYAVWLKELRKVCTECEVRAARCLLRPARCPLRAQPRWLRAQPRWLRAQPRPLRSYRENGALPV